MWLYKDTEYKEINNEELYGFIYKITYKSGKWYIGKKNFYHTISLPMLNNFKKRKNHINFTYSIGSGKRIYKERIKKETNWINYNGSSKSNISEPIVKKEILEFALSKRHLTYLETKYLFLNNALEDEYSINENILGKFYKNNLI